MLKNIKSHWKRAISGLLAVVMAVGMLPASSFAADTSAGSNPYAPTDNFELNVAGSTAWNGGDEALAVYKTESGNTQVTAIPAAVPFVLLEDKGGDRIKIGYVSDGGWTGGNLDSTGWVDKDSVLVNLPDVLPSIAYESDGSKQFSSRLTRFEYAIPGAYDLAEQLALLQKEAMASGETLVIHQSGQTVSVSRAKGNSAQGYTLDGVTYPKYGTWTEYETADNSLSDLSYELPFYVDRAYSADPSVTLTMFCPQTVNRAPARVSASDPTGGVGAYNPGSPGGKKPTTSNVAWSSDREKTFLRFTLIEFPQGVVTDLNTNDWSTWHVVGTPLNVVWSDGWSADKCRSDITWYNSCAMQYNGMGSNAAQLIGGTVYSYDATAGGNKNWVTTADEFQKATGITDEQKEQMFHCNSGSWSTGWTDGDYTSMWGTDAESVTPGNLYKVYKANDAFLYLLNRLSSNEGNGGWSADEAMERWSEYVHDTDGNLRTKYRIIVETGAIVKDPDGYRRAYTLRDMMAYSLYNNEGFGRYTLIYDQSSTMVNMARWMRQAKDNQYLEYPLDENGTPTGEELHSTNGFTEADSFVDTIQYARPMRDTIFSERRSFGLHIFSPFNFEAGDPAKPWLEVTKKAGEGVSAGDEWTFTVKYTAGTPTSFTAKKNGTDCTDQVMETGSGLKFKLKAGETIRIDFDADSSFRCEVTEDDTSKLTGITGSGGTADMTAKKFTTTSGVAKVTFTNGTEPPPPDKPDEPDEPTPGKAILFKRDANTNKGVGPATFKFSSVVNGVYEFDTNASGELETIQWWDPTEAAGKYIKPGEYAVSEIVPPPNYLPTTEVQQIKLELDADGNPIHAGPLVFKNQAKVGLRVLKYDRQSHTPMNGVTFEIFKDGVSIGRYETKGQGEILLTGIDPGTYLAIERDTGDAGHLLDTSYQEVELVAGGGTKELIFFNDNKPGMRLIKVDSADLSKTIPNAKFRIRAIDGSYGPQEFTTNGSGEIDLSMLPTGSYEVVEVECAGYVIDDTQRIIHLHPNDTAEFVFTNTRKPGFRLVKTSADGSPLDGVTFRIARIEDGSRYLDRTTQNGGEITVDGLEPGIYSVQEAATLPDHVLDKTEYHVELSPGKVAELRLSNDKKPLLTLSKVDADTQQPIPNTVLTVKALDGTYQDDWKTGADGKVSKIVDPGVYQVTEKSVPSPYYIPDKDADRTQTITLGPNDEKTLVFRNRKAPELTVFKENSITSEPIEHAKFHITYTSNGEAADAPATIDYGEVFTDSRGEIKVHELGKRLYPGEFTITEVEPADGFQLKEPLTQTVIIHGNESKTVRFQNTPLSALVVWKYDSVTSAPVEGAIFQVRYMSGTSGSGGTVIGTYKTGPGGSFTINRLQAGAYLVEELASDGDHVMDTAPQTAYISGKEQDVVQLYFGNSPKGAILLKKIDAVTHEPLSDCEFFITDSHGTMLGDANGKFVTDSAGTILISNLDPGTTVVARETRAKPNYILDDVPQTATIKAGQTVTLEFRNQPKGSVTLYKYSSLDRRTPLEGVGFKITFADGKVVDNIGGKLSSNGIYYTDSEGQINISGVTGVLEFTEISTIPGYLIDENRKSQTIAVNPDDHQSVYFYNQPIGNLVVKKMSSTTKEPLSDVIIRITRTDGTVVGDSNGEFRTDEAGFIKIPVEPGSYIVQEVKSKPGFLLDDTPKTIEIKGPGTYNIELFNQPLGSLVIHKYSSLDRKTPLAGVQFKVAYAPGCVVDDENGKVSSNGIYYTGPDGTITIDGIVGTVTITEQATIPGYTIDPETRSQTIVVNPDDVQHAYFYNSPKNTLIIEKYLETESGNEPLKGVTFLVTDSSGAVVGNSNGEFISGEDGRVVIAGVVPGTTVNVREIKVPEGVVLDSTPKSIKIGNDGANVLRFYNKKTGYLVIRKLDKISKEPLANVEFELTYADGSYVDDNFGHLSSKGRFKTNDAGEIRVPVVGTVVVKEVKTLPTHVIDAATQIQTIQVNPADTQTIVVYNEPLCSLTLRKVDATNGKPVPNTEFTLKNGDGNILGRYTTGADGTVTVTGLMPNSTVVVVESKVPSNYVLDPTPRTIIVRNGSNSVASGGAGNGGNVSGGNTGSSGGSGSNNVTVENLPKTTLTIEKYLQTDTGEQPLKGVTFLVTDSSGAVIGSSNGEFTSDKNGRIVIPNLEPGITVTAKEIRVPDGVVLDPTPKSIKIEGGIGGQTLRFVNQRAGNLIINKVDGIDKHPLSGVTFKITYADGSNVDQDGGKTSSNGIYTTDANGQIKISNVVGTVKIMEIETIPGYYIDEKYRTQTVEIKPNDTQTVTVYNVPTQALVIQKFVTGSKDQPLAGVEFLVTDSDGTVLGPNNGIYKTDQFGRITIKDLTPGTVITAREIKTLDGYVLDSTPQSIEIKSGEVQMLTFYNAPIGGLELIKVNEADKTQRIKGVTFEIRKMDGALVDTVTTGDRGRVHVSLDAGDYYCVEVEAAEGFKLDSTPHHFTIRYNETTTLTVTNAPFSGIILHKIDSVTGLGIYAVKFLVYDQNKNPIGEYTTDDGGYIYIDDLTVQGKGRLYIRELEAAPGYELDKQYKTVYVQPGKTIEVEWENTPITGQFQVYKYAAEYNEVTGTPAGAPLQGAVYEISEARSGRVVDYITTDARGVAASKPLPLGRYKITEVTAPAYWQVSGKTFDETLEYSGQIIKVSDYDKPSNLGVTITKRGNAEVLAGSQMRYDFTVANTSNVPLENYYWHDRVPTDAARATIFTTGTYSARLNYRILYKTNYSGVYQVLASNLITSSSYSFSLNAIPMQAGEYVTDVYLDFGKVPVGFQSVANPTLTVTVSGTAANGYQLINRADVGGKYQGTWQTAQATWVTLIRKLTNTVVPTLPKTGY